MAISTADKYPPCSWPTKYSQHGNSDKYQQKRMYYSCPNKQNSNHKDQRSNLDYKLHSDMGWGSRIGYSY